MQRLLIAIAAIFIGPTVAYAQLPDLGSWNIVNIKYNHDTAWSAFGEAQLRSLKFYDHFHYYEYKGGINYRYNKQLQLTLAAGSYQTYREGGNFVTPKNNDEFRLWPQVLLNQTIGKIRIEQRYRAELRFTSAGYRNRFRYRVGVSYNFRKRNNTPSKYQISANNELFFTNHEPYFERNRSQVTIIYKATKHVALQIGYLHQFDYRINDETGRDFLTIGWYYEIDRNRD